MSKTALITGASSGIGAAFARALARDGYHVIVVARREDRLRALCADITVGRTIRAEALVADLADPTAPATLVASVKDLGMQVDLLINNAGLGHHGAFADGTASQDLQMLDLNVTALTALTRAFLPPMLERQDGAVINVASTASFQPVPYFAIYAASKAYVLAFSEAIALELAPRGVRVLCLCPGATASEFIAVANMQSDLATKAPAMSAEAVVEEALQALRAGRTVHVTGLLNTLGALAPRFAPRGLVSRISGMLFKPSKGRTQ